MNLVNVTITILRVKYYNECNDAQILPSLNIIESSTNLSIRRIKINDRRRRRTSLLFCGEQAPIKTLAVYLRVARFESGLTIGHSSPFSREGEGTKRWNSIKGDKGRGRKLRFDYEIARFQLESLGFWGRETTKSETNPSALLRAPNGINPFMEWDRS